MNSPSHPNSDLDAGAASDVSSRAHEDNRTTARDPARDPGFSSHDRVVAVEMIRHARESLGEAWHPGRAPDAAAGANRTTSPSISMQSGRAPGDALAADDNQAPELGEPPT